jgi:Tol biopolymer transport system component
MVYPNRGWSPRLRWIRPFGLKRYVPGPNENCWNLSAHDCRMGRHPIKVAIKFTTKVAAELATKFATKFAIKVGLGWLLVLAARCVLAGDPAQPTSGDPQTAALAAEVRAKGWIAFGARSEQGDWDLFLCRPDGSQRRSLTRTPEFSEFAPQFSRDGRKLLYRRIPKLEKLDNNRHGEQGELVLANSDDSEPQVLGKPGEFPWASLSPDARQIACLSIKGISIVDLSTRQAVRTLPRKGFFQQTTWSPDGQWLSGVANSYGTGWSIARMDLATGEANPVNTVDCCTPDWFPDSEQLIFSWRPPGQKANNGYGWTQLWRADAMGKTRQLVYGEDGRHVYGGNVSPDGRYVLFTGNTQEDGDPGNAGAPMGLMRLQDGPIIGGVSTALRALHPEAKHGPVLALPAGWEPCWTFAEIAGPAPREGARQSSMSGSQIDQTGTNGVATLAAELHGKGWLAFSARIEHPDWDLFLMRPDGSDRHRITDTRQFNEAGVRFSPDGTRLLYYRMPSSEPVDNNTYGTFELVIANADGSQPVVYGNGFQWASWSPDGRQIACLAPKGIQIVDLATHAVVRQLPRKGIVSQLGWSPDGKRFVGTANGLGPFWNIGCLNPETGEIRALSETDRYNCTPDWIPDSHHVVYARGIIPQAGGRAELWVANIDGQQRQRIYAEQGRHIYGACASPDGQYALFTRSVEDLGQVAVIEMAVIRWPSPTAAGTAAQATTPTSSAEPQPTRIDLGPGWEPHWTLTDVETGGRKH